LFFAGRNSRKEIGKYFIDIEPLSTDRLPSDA